MQKRIKFKTTKLFQIRIPINGVLEASVVNALIVPVPLDESSPVDVTILLTLDEKVLDIATVVDVTLEGKLTWLLVVLVPVFVVDEL